MSSTHDLFNRLNCHLCGKSVSTPVSQTDFVLRAALICPECLETKLVFMEDLNSLFESETFHTAMLSYRYAPLVSQEEVIIRFEAVKALVRLAGKHQCTNNNGGNDAA